jgi:hypothetical protein
MRSAAACSDAGMHCESGSAKNRTIHATKLPKYNIPKQRLVPENGAKQRKVKQRQVPAFSTLPC